MPLLEVRRVGVRIGLRWQGRRRRAGLGILEFRTCASLSQKSYQRSSGVKHLEALPDPIPAVNQIEIHPWCQQRPIVEYCQKHGIVLQAYSPLSRASKARIEDVTVKGIAEKHGKDWAQILVRWSLQKGYVALIRGQKC